MNRTMVGAVLGETVGREARVAVLQGTGRKMRPVQGLGLGAGEAEHEILREALSVALDLLVQALGSYAVEGGEIGIEDGLVGGILRMKPLLVPAKLVGGFFC
jgi:hypothetical protein